MTFLKVIDLFHAFGDCLDLQKPLVVEGKIFMPFHEWKPPTGEEIDDSHMVDENPELSVFALQDDTRSESGISLSSRASWKRVVTQQSWKSMTSLRLPGTSRLDIERRICERMPPVAQSAEERPVPQGLCASLQPDMVYVQRGSCPAEARTFASEIS